MHPAAQRILIILLVLVAAISTAYIIANVGEEGVFLADEGTGVEISPFVPTPTPAPELANYCPPKNLQWPSLWEQRMGVLFTSLVGNNQGMIKGENFCIAYQEGQYMAVLDIRSGDPVAEVRAWFEENMGKYGYDTCFLMTQLRLITLRDGPGHPVQLCESERDPAQEEPVRPKQEGDSSLA